MRHLVAAAGLALIGCDQVQSTQVKQDDGRICLTPPTPAQGDWAGCIHRWAYKLAGAQEASRNVAQAAITACAEAIAWQVNQAAPEERAQLLQDINRSTPGIAMYRVIQARAGRCAIP